MVVNIIILARIQTFSCKEPSPRQHRPPEFVTLSFVLEVNHFPELNGLCQAYGKILRKRLTYDFGEDLHELPQMILINVTMEQVSVGRHITWFPIPCLGIKRRSVWVNNKVPVG